MALVCRRAVHDVVQQGFIAVPVLHLSWLHQQRGFCAQMRDPGVVQR